MPPSPSRRQVAAATLLCAGRCDEERLDLPVRPDPAAGRLCDFPGTEPCLVRDGDPSDDLVLASNGGTP